MGSATYSRISRGHSPFAINFARALIALPIFVIAVLFAFQGPIGAWGRLTEIPLSQFTWLALSIFASYGIGDVLFMWSTRSLGVPAALAVASTYPLLTAGVGTVLQGESLAFIQVVGLILTVSGVVIVILNGAEATPPSSDGAHAAPSHLTRKSVGVILAFGTMFMWALNSVATVRVGRDLNPLLSNSIRMSFALLMSFSFSRMLAPKTEVILPLHVLKKFFPIFVFEGFGGSLLFVYGLSHSSLAIGSTLASLAPVLAVPVAWFLRLEKFSIYRTLGVCLVVFGLWLLLGVF